MLIIIGGWNANVGNRAELNVMGKFGLGVRHEEEDWFMDLPEANNLSIMNTCFNQPTDDCIYGYH